MSIEITKIDPREAQHLIRELDDYQKTLYPPESCHFDSIETLRTANVRFYGALENNEIIAIGAVKLFDNYGEIKRIYVPIAQRGKRLAQKIMAVLENEIMANDLYISRLETGPKSKDAIGLYLKLGYVEREKFGTYKLDTLSTFMEKSLIE